MVREDKPLRSWSITNAGGADQLFLSQTNENWPEREFTGATAETLEEVKAEVRERTDRPQQDNLNSFVTSKQKENHWRLDSTRFSKWYGTKPRNKLEIEISLVRARSWVYRYLETSTIAVTRWTARYQRVNTRWIEENERTDHQWKTPWRIY